MGAVFGIFHGSPFEMFFYYIFFLIFLVNSAILFFFYFCNLKRDPFSYIMFKLPKMALVCELVLCQLIFPFVFIYVYACLFS